MKQGMTFILFIIIVSYLFCSSKLNKSFFLFQKRTLFAYKAEIILSLVRILN